MRIRQIKPEDRKRRSAMKSQEGRQWNNRWAYPDDDKEREILDMWNTCDDPLNSIQDLSSTDMAEIPFNLDDYIKHFNGQKPDVKGKSTNGVCDWLRSLSLNDLPTKPPQMPLKSPDNDDSSMAPEHQTKHVVYRLVYEKSAYDEQNYKWEVSEETSKKVDKKPPRVMAESEMLINFEESKKVDKKPSRVMAESEMLIDFEESKKVGKKPSQVMNESAMLIDLEEMTESVMLIDLEEKNELPMAPTHKISDDLRSLDMDQWHKFFARH
ncbi:2036_t:CDS:2 [Cetraspora pellucida]|uniref:2036_t:CDS:1 n=1 Tax=Cetraspora pellucida TaxID=1433469 RepID=A0A9N9HLP2_9GLOM|nr:2036_t:CDS:2 [Cetraspora pellucida]